MLTIVIAALLTASYRFLPDNLRYQIDALLDNSLERSKHLEKPSSATSTEEKKKYVLKLPDPGDFKKATDKTLVASAYIQRLEGVQVHDEGRVTTVLSDDRKGSKHQRFIVRTDEDISVLIAHNIDLAKRVKNIKQGDAVEFFGEYVWNEKGGVVHWTHHDPDGRHVSGWLKHDGTKYQ
ncbi:MAG: DUF3465 domain-containing protein [Gammaproteobacteria bacterium]|nr:MAG: DUF3465 domain-containing protein [Gammaproteobacteria bacterium]